MNSVINNKHYSDLPCLVDCCFCLTLSAPTTRVGAPFEFRSLRPLEDVQEYYGKNIDLIDPINLLVGYQPQRTDTLRTHAVHSSRGTRYGTHPVAA